MSDRPASRFPRSVRKAMAASGATATCVPVKLELDTWETAFFVQLSGPECKGDRRILSQRDRPLPIGVETELIEHQHAAVVMLRLEVHTDPDDPLAAEILMTPGEGPEQFDTLKLLAKQSRLCWFFGDQDYWTLHSQQHPLEAQQHASFDELLRDAARHDALIRCTGRYDAKAALAHVISHYELRAHTSRPHYSSSNQQRSR